MKRWMGLSLLMLCIHSYSQVRTIEAMPQDAQQAIHAQLSKRLAARLEQNGADTILTSRVKELRDPLVLHKIEANFDGMRVRKPQADGAGMPPEPFRRFESITKARLEFKQISISNIPEDKLLEVAGVTKLQLRDEAFLEFPDTGLLDRINLAFPRDARDTILLLNTLTPVDADIIPAMFGIPTFDPLTLRSTQRYSRKRYGSVGILADISVTPYAHICSGTLISENWFLTATHCFFDASKEKIIPVENLGVFFPFQGGAQTVRRLSDGKESKNLQRRSLSHVISWYGEASGLSMPGTAEDMAWQIELGNDVALIGLNALLPARSTANVVTIPTSVHISPPLTLAGYGRTNAAAPVGDLLLEVGLRRDIVFTDDSGALLKNAPESFAHANARICFGDSGGPAFLGGVDETGTMPLQLVAIASLVGKKATMEQSCETGLQQFTRVDRPAVRAWLCAKAGAAC